MRFRVSKFFLLAATTLIMATAPPLVGCSSDDPSQAPVATIHALTAEKDAQGTYTLAWAPIAADAVVEVTAGTSPNGIDRQTIVGRTVGGTGVTITGLDTTKRWYFEVGSPGGTRALVAERHLELQGSANYRDLGGYLASDGHAVRWGAVYRSDALGKLTPADVDYLTGLGLKVAFDLRTDDEVKSNPDALADGSKVAYKRGAIDLPINVNDILKLLNEGKVIDEAWAIDLYKGVIDRNAGIFAQLFTEFAEAGTQPIVFHCTAGKDRTGISAALLLSTLGIPDDVIGQDFALTDKYMDKIIKAQEAVFREKGVDPAKLGGLIKSRPEVIKAALSYVREKHGSVDAYLASGGLDAQTLAKVRATLRTP